MYDARVRVRRAHTIPLWLIDKCQIVRGRGSPVCKCVYVYVCLTRARGCLNHWRALVRSITAMKIHEAEQVLRQISYKPGWKLSWNVGHGPYEDSLMIRWNMRVPDAYDHSREVNFTSATTIHHLPELDAEGLVREVHRLTVRAEIHEADEFFMYGDERPFDPHRSVVNEGERFG